MLPETTVLITGSDGFVGRNLQVALKRMENVRVLCFNRGDDLQQLSGYLQEADMIFHLAGVNRPKSVEEYAEGNTGLIRFIVSQLDKYGLIPAIVMTSSTQAALDNPYGNSKREAENILMEFCDKTGSPLFIYRLTNVFGKWSRPNYNSVVSTFCHNISHNIQITISDPANEVELVYVDDVVSVFTSIISGKTEPSSSYLTVSPTYHTTLGDLADRIYKLRDIRSNLTIPDLSDDFNRKLHATYLSYLDQHDFSYNLEIRTDNRGSLAELIKSAHFGQMFISSTHKGVTRGNHYHDTKIEKFCVLQGEAAVRFRHLFNDQVIEYTVSGTKWQVVDIPPGYTHHIENMSDGEMIVLFWANEIFDQQSPDTYFCEVNNETA